MRIERYESRWKRPLCEIWFDSFESAGLAHSPETTIDSLTDRLDAEIQSGWEVFVAFDAETLSGFMAIDPAKQYLNQLFVARAAQGRGMGKALLDLAKQAMSGDFRLRTHADNIGAQRFYEREGLVRETTETHPRFGHLTHVYIWRASQT